MKPLTDSELIERGWSIPIRRAVEAAGGDVACAYAFGLKTSNTICAWYVRRSIKATQIHRLCELGGFKVKPEDILADLAENRAVRAESRVAA